MIRSELSKRLLVDYGLIEASRSRSILAQSVSSSYKSEYGVRLVVHTVFLGTSKQGPSEYTVVVRTTEQEALRSNLLTVSSKQTTLVSSSLPVVLVTNLLGRLGS